MSEEYLSRVLPNKLVQYDIVRTKITIDCIPVCNVIAPLFIVPALDKEMRMNDVGLVGDKSMMYYVLTNRVVQCLGITPYQKYLENNNTLFSNRRANASFNYFNFNPFLTVDNMQTIKATLDVG